MAPPSAALLFGAVAAILLAFALTKKEVYYLDLEHVNLTYWNRKYFGFVNISTGRRSRRDPIHYMNIHFETLVPLGNNVSVDWDYYEFLSNEYRRSFVELRARLCDLMLTDQYFSPFIKHHFPNGCPLAPGVFHVENISFSNLPVLKTFPFTKGRLYGSYYLHGGGGRLVEFYVNADIKQRRLN